jgi:hypothetical protein
MEILSVDGKLAAGRLDRDGAAPAEGIGDLSTLIGSIEDLANQCVRAACPPTVERDRWRVDLTVSLLMSHLAIKGLPINALQQVA